METLIFPKRLTLIAAGYIHVQTDKDTDRHGPTTADYPNSKIEKKPRKTKNATGGVGGLLKLERTSKTKPKSLKLASGPEKVLGL